MNKLERQFISQDSATQRAGRAGRLSAGKAYHLWHKSKILLKHDTPEILQADLSQLVLDLALWGNESIDEFRWMDTPPPSAIGHAKKLLKQLGALDKKGVITQHGKAMNRFGLHPRLSHMIIKAKELNLEYEASLLCVILTEKDFSNSRSADIKERVTLLHELNTNQKIHQKVNIREAKQMLKIAKRLSPIGLASADANSINQDRLGLLLAFAYPDRIAQLRHKNRGVYLLSNGKGATLHQEDELFNTRFLVVADLDGKSTNATIYKAIEITLEQIEEYLSEQIETQNVVSWNDEQERVEVRRVEKLGAIVIKEMQTNKASDEEIAEVLLEELEELGLDALNWSKEALRLRERLDFLAFYEVDVLRRLKPTLQLSDSFSSYLAGNMDVWLKPYLMGKRTLRECKSLDLYPIILGLFDYAEQQEIERLAPKKLKVASGSNIFLDYSNPEQPILAVRLQEMFGTKSTPTVLNGKVKLMIHLLSPASRPMQMTQDLESFWVNTYDEVKKELRGKYKKHYWPDNPLEAQATSRSKKRM
jgi:ATP-dependent helicase HrpB